MSLLNTLVLCSFVYLAGFAMLVWFLDWFSSKLIDAIWPPSADEIMRRETDQSIQRADKECRKRQRLGAARFWNF